MTHTIHEVGQGDESTHLNSPECECLPVFIGTTEDGDVVYRHNKPTGRLLAAVRGAAHANADLAATTDQLTAVMNGANH